MRPSLDIQLPKTNLHLHLTEVALLVQKSSSTNFEFYLSYNVQKFKK